jgi:hypothetical protein
MTTVSPDPSQRRAARAVGLSYLLALLPGIFAEFYVLDRLVVSNDAAQTASNIVAHERLFRLGIASNLLVIAIDVVLIASLYVVLERINRGLALVAAFFRLIETAILVVAVLNDFSVLRILSGAEYLRVFEPDRLQALARLSIGAHGSVYNVALFLFGLGSSVFGYLWFRSGYIPRALAGWGVFASLLVGVCTFGFIIFPELAKTVTVVYYAGPIFLFELAMGLWLPIRGLRPAVGTSR